MSDEFEGRVALITGGASGIGRAIAEALARQRAKVIVVDVNEGATARTQRDLRAQGLAVDAEHADVTSAAAVEALAKRVFAKHQTVHLLFNNAGVGVKEAKRRLWTLPEEDWQWGYGVNVMGVVNAIRAFVPTMLERGEPGHVINTSSGNGGVASLPTTPIYASSKAAVTSLTEVLHYQFLMERAELKAHVLYPGPHLVNTNILNSEQSRPAAFRVAGEFPSGYVSMEALAKSAGVEFALTEPEEVAEMALRGIRQGLFWILHKDGSTDQILRRRTDSILARENPPLPTPA